MPNLYIWFETKAERREFTEKLLSISLTGHNVSRGELGLYYENLKNSLDQMENDKIKGPYYLLYKKFYLGKTPEARFYNRYSAAEVIRRGYRNIYY